MFEIRPDIDSDGTSLKGYITTSFDKLKEVFGEPSHICCDRVSTQWTFRSVINGSIFTLYDYKETTGDHTSINAFRMREIYDFHVGGKANALKFILWLRAMIGEQIPYKVVNF